MDISSMNPQLKAKIAVYHYSQIGDIETIADIVLKYEITPIGLGFAIYTACKYGMLKLVRYLKCYIEKKCTTNFLDATQMVLPITAAACYSGNIELINFLIDNGAILNTFCLNKVCKIKEEDKRSQMIRYIISKTDIENYESALINLMILNDCENSLYILNTAPIDKIKHIIINIIRFAAYKNIYDIFNWLIERFNIDNHTLVICAMHFLNISNCEAVDKIVGIKNIFADTDVVNFLVDATYNKYGVYSFHYIYSKSGLDFNYFDYRIIRCCAETGNLQLMKELIEENCVAHDLNIQTNEKWKSCLEHCFRSACYYNHIEVAKFLIGMNIDPNCEMEYSIKNEYLENDNGLILAAKNDNLEIVKWLLSFVQYSQETVAEAVYEAALFSEKGSCIELLFEKSDNVDYKSTYSAAIKNSIGVAKIIYDLQPDAVENTVFELDNFKCGDFFLLELENVEYLQNTHPILAKQLLEKTVHLSKMKKDFGKMLKYIDEYENNFKKSDYSITVYDTLLLMSLFESNTYFYGENLKRYNSFKDGMKNLTLYELSKKIDTNSIDMQELEKIMTITVSRYYHRYNRYDFYWDFYYDNNFFKENIEYSETVENIKILDLCDRHNINIDYKKVFDENLIDGDFILVKNKISVDYVSEKVTDMFDTIPVQQLKKIKYIFSGLKIKQFPVIKYYTVTIDKIKFLLDYFDANLFFENLNSIRKINNECMIFLLNTSTLHYDQYKKLVKILFTHTSYDFFHAKIIIDIIVDKLCGNKNILDVCIKYSFIDYEIQFLDYLIDIGASIYSDMNVKNMTYREDTIEKLRWLKNKSFNITKYSDNIVSNMIDRLNHDLIVQLREIGCIISIEAVIYWYSYSSTYEGKYEDYLSLSDFDNRNLIDLCETYLEIIYYEKSFIDKFTKLLENFNFEYESYLFFRCICFMHNTANNDINQTILDMIKEKYQRVNFFIEDYKLMFRITSIKRAIY